MERVIKIESGVKYLSECMSSLPANCLFSKGKTGCGGSTLAIESNVPYVIAVPFVSLIENKVGQYDGKVFGFYGGVKIGELKDYLTNTENPIIITTFDSIDVISKYIDTKEFKLLVDEYHLLFTQYSFRDVAINRVLSSYKNYKEYCFMTATPLDEEFVLDELKDLDIVIADWDDITEVSVISVKCVNGVLNTALDLVNGFLNNKEEGNLYLFVNSVDFIKTIVESTSVTADNCNVIYSKSNKTEVGIERGSLPSKKDGSIPTKKINLLTSTVFEGADIYDPKGKIYIVSDASRAHTLVDISTSFQQIAGRIRNSIYIGEICHLYTNTRYTDVTYEEFKENSLKEVEECKVVVEEYNKLSSIAKSKMNIKPNESYITVDGDVFLFNPNLVKLDIYNFKVCKHLYKIRVNTLNEELIKCGYVSHNYTHTTETRFSKDDLEGFEVVVSKLESFVSNTALIIPTVEQEAYKEAAYLRFPFLAEAISKIGFKGIKDEKYVQTNIKRKLISMLDKNTENKVFLLLKGYGITQGEFITSKALKIKLTDAYKTLGIEKTAKATDITNYFNAKKSIVKRDSKVLEGFTMLNAKYTF